MKHAVGPRNLHHYVGVAGTIRTGMTRRRSLRNGLGTGGGSDSRPVDHACQRTTKNFVDIYERFRRMRRDDRFMKRTGPPKPTDAELAILRVLWRRGPSTVRQVMEELNRRERTGYTTVLKLMQIMSGKGLVERDDAERTHVYRPALRQEQTQRQLVGHLLDRAFAGSAQKLVMQALAARKATGKELAEIRKLLDQMEGDSR
jgi:BlaI family penicillinase repressor